MHDTIFYIIKCMRPTLRTVECEVEKLGKRHKNSCLLIRKNYCCSGEQLLIFPLLTLTKK